MSNIIHGTENDDEIIGTTGVDTLYGYDGNDYLQGNGDDDFLYGGNDDDTLIGGAGNDEVHGGSGNDWLRGGSGTDFLYGDDGDDTIQGGLGNDAIQGGNGNDRLFGDDGNDVLSGGAGEDIIKAGKGNDTVSGGADKDVIFGEHGDDTLNGDAGNDVIYGDGDNDTINGQEGDDTVIGGAGDDNVSGGVGNDSVRGGSGEDKLFGNEGNDTLEGGLGNDELTGGEGNDRLFGNDGEDIINADAGNDKVRAGNGNDTVNGGDGRDVLFGDNGDDIINGDGGTDVLWGGNGIDTIKGGADDDSLWGQAGNDLLYGEDGNDTARGGEGNDRIEGANGNDSLWGGTGDDHLIGDDGTDPTINTGTGSQSAGVSIRADGPAVQSGLNHSATTTAISIDGVPYVVTTQWAVSGLSIVYRVESDGSLTETDRMTYNSSEGTLVTSSSGDITSDMQDAGLHISAFGNGLTQSNIFHVDGNATLFMTSQNSGSITAWHIAPDGTFSLEGGLRFGHSQTHLSGGIVRENVVFEAENGQEYIFATRPQNDRIDTLTYNSATSEIAETGNTIATGDWGTGLDIVTIDGATFLVSSANDKVSLFSVDAQTGALTLADSHTFDQNIGTYNSVNFYETSDGRAYAIVTGGPGESEIFVYELNGEGSLTLTDSISGNGVRYTSAGEVDGEPVFISPNATEGVDLYTLSDEGKLVLQTTIKDIENDVTTPVIVQTKDGSYFLVDADGNTASVKLDTSQFQNRVINDFLDGQEGNDTLEGGAGDDILRGGVDNDKIYGGDGHDYLIGDDRQTPTLSISAAEPVISSDTNASATTTAITVDGVAYVVTTQWAVSGLSIVYRVENDGSLTETDRMTYDSSAGTVTTTSSGDISADIQEAGVPISSFGNGLTQSNIFDVDGDATLFMTSQNSGSITAWHIAPDGTFSLEGGLRFGHSQTHLSGGIVRENVVFEALDGQEYIYASRSQNDRIDTLTYDSQTGEIAETGNTIATGDWGTGLDIITINGQTFLVSSANDSVSLFSVDQRSGALTLADTQTFEATLGTYNGVNFYETSDGKAYAIVSGGPGESNIYVYELNSEGSLALTDTIEGGGARYSSAGYVDGEPVFVAPNPEEGVDLFTLSKDGKLVHQTNIAGIENDVTAPVIVQTEDGSYYLVDADGNAATVKLNFDYDIGNTDTRTHNDELYGGDGDDRIEGNYGDDKLDGGSGTDALFGGNGDDFLTGGQGNDTLTGGKGADVFFFDSDSGSDTVTDFNLRQDAIEIDASLAISFGQLNIAQSGANTVVSNSEGSVHIILEDVKVTELDSDMFNFT
ncbi:alkaline phosphatase [Enterovibrio norvegicus]|uniref:calcium-binding protein n=1 Tax=Enterovibrio norvegicus TaxID=188144 RepID=UPI000C820578|nr:beta-propeller fold lactonase family protein [Enterovibrio norvegicus]MCC4799364.1 beta-propeller fold lactonase family protein [Enterovibrio norvegicus]PMH67259.1 alkaline phosphatase [Enterovibrio norvegicus]PMI34159.1 alkaline phosphatase [Enterovibrio norvegicus]PMN55012.1 alkaline phosphatase [Enterovibrio norvegicus]